MPNTSSPTPQDRLDALNLLRFESHSGTSALHIAAFYGHAKFVEYLLLDCGMDPIVEDALTRRPLQLVNDQKDPTGTVRALLVQVTRKQQIQTFTDRLLSCSGTLLQLESLAKSLSSVYDLRAVFSLSKSALAHRPDEMKHVLTLAFTRLIDEKLVFNDREALFSKMALRECLQCGLVTQTEFEYWNMQVVKVNMESATWVSALKQAVLRIDVRVTDTERRIRLLQNEYKNLRTAVLNQEGGDTSTLGQSLSMVTSLLGVLDVDTDGVIAIGDAFDNVLDLSNPQDVLGAMLKATGTGDVAGYLGGATSALVVPAQVQETFEAAGVDLVEFAGLLKDVILREQENDPSDEVSTTNTDGPMAEMEVGKRFANLTLEDDDDAEDVSDDPLVAFPFHFAVKQSGGDLHVFQDVTTYIEPVDGDVNASTNVMITSPDGLNNETLELSVVEYASYLGFVDIVRHLLTQPDIVVTEKKFVTMQRAQQRAVTVTVV